MKKLIFMILFLSLCTVCFADVKNETITQKVSELEQIQNTETQYLQKLQQEINAVTQRIIARSGAIQGLKDLIAEPITEEQLKNAEIIEEQK